MAPSPSLLKQITNPAGSDPNEQLNKLRCRHGEERHIRFTRNGSGEQGLARARGAHQKHSPGNFGAKPNERFRLFQEGDDLLELLLGLVDPRHILKTHLKVVLRFDPGLAAPEPKGAIRNLCRSTQQERQADNDQKDQREVANQPRHGLLLTGIDHLKRGTGLLCGAQNLLIVGEDRHRHRAPIPVNRLHLTSAWNQLKGLDLPLLDLFKQRGIAGSLNTRPPEQRRWRRHRDFCGLL